MKKIFAIILIGFSLWSCSGSDQKSATPAGDNAKDQNTVVISNDLENAAAIIPSWSNEKTVVKMDGAPAHSGQFVSMVDDQFEYSYGFHEYLDNINQSVPKKVHVKGWVYSSVVSPDLSIVLDISENNQLVEWKAYSLTPLITEAKKWTEFNAHFDITKPIKGSNLIKIFGWNHGKKLAYFDDFEITFEY